MSNKLPRLQDEEIRILGSLMEKSKTTPEYYPLTLNALVAACNQKTSRKPVVSYDENTVLTTLDQLKKKGLISTATGGSSRVTKYKHNFAVAYPLVPAEITIICLLLLRGPLTPGEINNNSGRMYEFESLDEVQELLDGLTNKEEPFVVQLPKRPGQKEARYIHLLSEKEVDLEQYKQEDALHETPVKNTDELVNRIETLEEELAKLRNEFDQLMQQLT